MLNGYMFYLDNIHIDNTRSRDEDTDYAALGVKVGDRMFPVQTISMGDVDNGDYRSMLSIGPIPIEDSGVNVTFNYQVVNAGYGDPSDVQKALTDGADALAGKLFDSGTVWGIIAAGGIEAVTKILVPLLTADCDGLVAADQISLTGAQLLNRTHMPAGGWMAYRETRAYPGTDSPHGCGGNSQYSVTFSVYHDPAFWTGWSLIDGLDTDAGLTATVLRDTIHAFAKGTDNRVYSNQSADGLHWTGWAEVPGGMTTDVSLSATSSDNRLWLFAKGLDQKIYLNHHDRDGDWTGWFQVAGSMLTDLPVGSAYYAPGGGFLAPEYVALLCKGLAPDEKIYWNYVKVGPPPLPSAPSAGSLAGPGVVHVANPPHLDLPKEMTTDAFEFGVWQVLPGGGLTDASPTAHVHMNPLSGEGELWVFVKGVGRPSTFYLRKQGELEQSNGWGTEWTEMGFVSPGHVGDVHESFGTTSPAAVDFGGKLEVFVGGTDKSIDFNSPEPDHFRVFPGFVQGSYLQTAVAPAVVVHNGSVQVFAAGTDQKAYVNSLTVTPAGPCTELQERLPGTRPAKTPLAET